VEPSAAAKQLRKPGSGPVTKEYELDVRECDEINSTLSDKTDVSGAKVLRCNTEPQRVFQGVAPGHEGFLLTAKEVSDFSNKSENNNAVIFPYLIGDEILTG